MVKAMLNGKKRKTGPHVAFVVWVTPRQDHDAASRRDCVKDEFKRLGVKVLGVDMPCGARYQFKAATFPTDDQGCICGEPTHWIVMWRRTSADGL